MSSLIGRNLGQYEIVDMLGRGGMATVYLGRQQSIDRHVAVKVLPPHPGLDDAFKERFQLEAKTIGSLQNPNILPLYDYDTFDDVIYLVMQYVEGGTLEDLMDGGPMSVPNVEKILRSIANGLDYAHEKGVIHRDIKPANILIQDNHPLLADFGMVKMVAGNSNLTGTSIVGTPSYMAPEQGQGLDVDHRVDVYSLGAMCYEMLAGRQPFKGDTPMQMILAHINNPVPDIRTQRPDLSQEVADVFTKVLAKNPDDRYVSAGAFAEAFSKAIHQNTDSLVQARKDMPIGKDTVSVGSPDATVKLNTSTDQIVNQTNPQPTQVIVQERTNPFVLMGGFGLIALVIVIVAVLLINNGNGDDSNDNTVVINPTDDSAVVAPNVTDDPPVPPTTAPVVISEEETFGEVRFTTENELGDRVEVRLNGVTPVQGDDTYVAWLLNTESDDVLLLGRVIVDTLGEGTITFTDPDGRMLAANYNAIIISQETDVGDTPSENIAYSSALPLAVTEGLREIFVASEDGLNGQGLLNGAITEADIAGDHAGRAANSTNIGGVRTHAEHTINILRGETEDYTGSGSGFNPGRGVGVYFFLDEIDSILQEAVTGDTATIDLQSNAEFIRVCTQNVRLWADDIIALEITMIAGESVEDIADEATESTALADQLVDGNDLNQNGIIEPFEGECGLTQIPDFGLQFARMDILEGDIANAE